MARGTTTATTQPITRKTRPKAGNTKANQTDRLVQCFATKQKEGFNYKAQHAVYDKKTAILTITSKFTAVMDKNIVHGNTGWYDSRRKMLFAKEVDAVVYTAEKQ